MNNIIAPLAKKREVEPQIIKPRYFYRVIPHTLSETYGSYTGWSDPLASVISRGWSNSVGLNVRKDWSDPAGLNIRGKWSNSLGSLTINKNWSNPYARTMSLKGRKHKKKAVNKVINLNSSFVW